MNISLCIYFFSGGCKVLHDFYITYHSQLVSSFYQFNSSVKTSSPFTFLYLTFFIHNVIILTISSTYLTITSDNAIVFASIGKHGLENSWRRNANYVYHICVINIDMMCMLMWICFDLSFL